MRLLIDTHALVWWLTFPDRLSRIAHGAIEDRENEVLVSAVSAYEIEYKRRRSTELGRVPADLREEIVRSQFAWLTFDERHAVVAGRLPRLHGDPFDRILAAQALEEDLTLVTCDRAIAAYGPPVLW